MTKHMSLSFAVALVTACGGDGVTGEELIGTWTGASFFGPVSMTFHADGTVDHSADGDVASGTWETDGDRLTLEGLPFGAQRVTSRYVVDGDRFIFASLLPDGDVDGVVGSWDGDITEDDVTRATTLELASGGTGHITFDGESPGTVVDADLTWELDPGLLRLEWQNTDNTSTARTYFAIPDVAIGGLLLQRAEPAP
jgi:hypothetical protein